MKTILAVVGAIVVAVVAYLAWYNYQVQQAISGPARELVSESIVRQGDTWHVDFVTKFDAPVDKIFALYSRPEDSKDLAPENVLKSDLVKEEGNVKVIDLIGRLDILPPGFKVQNVRTEYTFFPAEHRITSRTIDFKLADIASDYTFEATPDGQGTVLRFKQTSKDKAPMLVESLQKGALREQYLTTVRAVNRKLGLTPGADAEAG